MAYLSVLLFLGFFFTLASSASTMSCPNAIFSFGDSLADTGNFAACYPQFTPSNSSTSSSSKLEKLFDFMLATSSRAVANKLPFRSGDGRLVIDFVAQALRQPFLSPYFQNILPNYTQGINFAFSSSTARSTEITVPFHLRRQVSHYNYFKGNVYNAQAAGRGTDLPKFELFSTGIHWISIGINDFWQNYLVNHLTEGQLKSQVVPDIVASIVDAVKTLYGFGARNFMVVNVPAVGCLPQFLGNFGTSNKADYDSLGCLKNHNDVALTYASMLSKAVQNLRQQLGNAYIMYGDYYRLHLDAVTNPQQYGLSTNGTLSACCGGGGTPNIPVAPCGSVPTCSTPDEFITWDGLHFTEGFNRITATAFLQGNFVEPWPVSNLSTACNLDFSKFFR